MEIYICLLSLSIHTILPFLSVSVLVSGRKHTIRMVDSRSRSKRLLLKLIGGFGGVHSQKRRCFTIYTFIGGSRGGARRAPPHLPGILVFDDILGHIV